jgi:hypothetical protein
MASKEDQDYASIPEWVPLLCSVAVCFSESRQSFFELVQAASPDVSNRERFLSAVALYLHDRRDLIDSWALYSENKRTASGPYFKLGTPSKVGEVGGLRSVPPRRFHDPAEACAEFLWREVAPMDEQPSR